MIRVINGRKYLMRDTRPVEELIDLYVEFLEKYESVMPLHTWLVQRGKVYTEITESRKNRKKS